MTQGMFGTASPELRASVFDTVASLFCTILCCSKKPVRKPRFKMNWERNEAGEASKTRLQLRLAQ